MLRPSTLSEPVVAAEYDLDGEPELGGDSLQGRQRDTWVAGLDPGDGGAGDLGALGQISPCPARLARRLLSDDTVQPEDRVAGLLVLLYAQRAAAIAALTVEDVTIGAGGVRLRLGTTPVLLPAPLSDLVTTLVGTRTGHAAMGERGVSSWLFPGGQPGKPVSTGRMGVRLRGLGIRPNPARSAALFALAAEVPAAIRARTLGIHIDVAVGWQQASAGDWASYAADVGRQPTRIR